MGLVDSWNNQSSGVKAAILLVGILGIVVVIFAVTIILAAVIGAFVLGVGEETSTSPPQIEFECGMDGETLVITHIGGDSVPVDTLTVPDVDTSRVTMPPEELNAGDELRIEGVTEASLRWTDPGTGDSHVLVRC